MRITLVALLASATLLCGCSKNSVPETEAAAAVPETKGPAPSKEQDAMMAAALEDLNRKVQQQQYDAAVGALITMGQMPKTEAQEAQYLAKLRQTELELNKRAVAGDPAAQASAQMLGRVMTGR